MGGGGAEPVATAANRAAVLRVVRWSVRRLGSALRASTRRVPRQGLLVRARARAGGSKTENEEEDTPTTGDDRETARPEPRQEAGFLLGSSSPPRLKEAGRGRPCFAASGRRQSRSAFALPPDTTAHPQHSNFISAQWWI